MTTSLVTEPSILAAATPSREALDRAEARIRDLEAALEIAQRKVDGSAGPQRPELAAGSEQRFRALIENLHVGVVVQGPQSEILLFNARALELLGLTEDELFGRTSFDPSWEVIHEDGTPYLPEERPVAVVLTTHAEVRGVIMGIRRPRTRDVVWLLVNAMPERDAKGDVVQVVATLDDISERKRLDDSMREGHQLESLGLLAGGIAHDFNNLLTVISSSAELARMSLPPDSPVGVELDDVIDATERATVLTRQLLTFARRSAGEAQRLDMALAIERFQKLLGRLLEAHHELSFTRPKSPVPVRIDQGQLEQVLVNLVVNARDAMPEGGSIELELSYLEPGQAPDPLHERPAALLCVRDTGVGIPPELLTRVVEPLFTTKPEGKGTGLGLATVQGIVRSAGGRLRIESEVGHGTSMLVYLPLLTERSDTDAREQGDERILGVGRGELIVLADDDPVLRSVTARMLSELGYRPLEAEDGFAALDIFERRGEEVTLLLADIIMPRMGGLELAVRVRERWPQVRVVVSSDFNARQPPEVGVGGVDGLLAKPYNMSRLGQLVFELLQR